MKKSGQTRGLEVVAALDGAFKEGLSEEAALELTETWMRSSYLKVGREAA